MQANLKRQQEITDLRNQGMTRKQIADKLGISKSLVGLYLNRLLHGGIIEPISNQERIRRSTGNRVAYKVDVREARQMRLDGKSYSEIAKHYGVSAPTITSLIGTSARITPRHQQLIKLRLQGLSYHEIADYLGKPQSTVGVMLSRLVKKGLIPQGLGGRMATQKVDVQEARQLRLDGKTFDEIAKRFGVCGPTIAKLIGHQAKGERNAKEGESHDSCRNVVGCPSEMTN